MRTTIALDEETRNRLVGLKQAWHLRSVEEVVRRLLEGPPASAQALYAAHKEAVDAALRRHGIRRLVAFGSRARGDSRPDSDLDLAGSMPPSTDLFDVVHAQDDLEAAFGLPVHFVALDGLQGRLKTQVEREGVLLAA